MAYRSLQVVLVGEQVGDTGDKFKFWWEDVTGQEGEEMTLDLVAMSQDTADIPCKFPFLPKLLFLQALLPNLQDGESSGAER